MRTLTYFFKPDKLHSPVPNPSSIFTDKVVVAQGWSEKQGIRTLYLSIAVEASASSNPSPKDSLMRETASLRIVRMLNVSATGNNPWPLRKEVQSCDVL